MIGGLFAFAGFASFVSALVCLVASVGGYLKYGDWHWPGWTVGATFGINSTLFAPDLVGAQKLAAEIAPINAGWGFLILAPILFLMSGVAEMMTRKPPQVRR